MLVGGATAAVVTRPDPTHRVEPNEEATMKSLIDEINRRDAQIKDLRKRLVEGQIKADEVERLKKQLDEKQDEVRQLTDQVTQLRVQQNAGPAPAAAAAGQADPRGDPGRAGPVQGCFEEWDDRADVFSGSGKPRLSHDADLIVESRSRPMATRTISAREASTR